MVKCKNEGCERTDIKGRSGLCGKCWRRNYRQTHKEQIRPVARAYYYKHRDKLLKQAKDWINSHRERVNEINMGRYFRDKELETIRDKTRNEFGYLIKDSKCEKCGYNEGLQFHHPKPYKFDNFQILCEKCHFEVHGKLLVRKTQNQALISKSEELK